MAEQNRCNSMREKRVAEQLWLEYFNNYLFEHGVITEKERNRMVSEINAYQTRRQQMTSKKKEDYCNSEIDML